MTRKRPFAVCITGPTATGKTAAAVAVCQALGGEVLSMDSMQVYKGLDIGTAKANAAEMGGIAHHLLSFVSPDTPYTVAEYQRDAEEAMADVLCCGKLPVFAGGTGLYLQAVSRPMRFTGAGGAGAVRAALEAEAALPDGRASLYEQLASVDPATAARLHPNNVRRVIRALEVYAETGLPMSAQTNEWEAEPEADWLIFALHWPRDVLYDRINRRVDQIMAEGLPAEVQGLLAQGVSPQAQAMQAIGYKELVQVVQGTLALDAAVDRIKMNTRRYAKRQLTWLRRDARVRWLDMSTFTDAGAVHAHLIGQITAYREEGNAHA